MKAKEFIPVATEQSRGLSTRVSMKQALKQQGFVGVLMPQGHRLGARDVNRAGGIAIVEGAGEGDDSDAGHCAPPA